MITDSNITTYIHSLDAEPSSLLGQLRSFAAENDVPIIRREMESFIRVLLNIRKPAHILEIGTAIGYSAIMMCEALEKIRGINGDFHITTIENYEPRIAQARENFSLSGYADHIEFIEEDAVQILAGMEGAYDMVFLDAAKGQYITLLPDITRLLKSGGILLADNVLTDGEITMSRYALPRRQRTIHERMREFIWEIKHSDDYETSVIPIGDGVTLSVRR